MAEEDEVDVLGDFNLDNFLAKNDTNIYNSAALVTENSELLNCDYTIHPQWLLDKPSANPDNWYDTNLPSALERSQSENDSLGHVSTENCITDESGWTEKEKNLLDRGIEIFGKSNTRLSQFIGSKSAAEVKYYLKNFYMETQSSYKPLNDAVEEIGVTNLVADVLNDTQIPASIEEVIAAVSTAKPTVHIQKKQRKKSSSLSYDLFDNTLGNIPSRQSYLKSSSIISDTRPGKTLKYKKHENMYIRQRKYTNNVKFKFKTKLKMAVTPNKEKGKKKSPEIVNSTNKTEFHNIEITTGKGLAVPICEGEEIVKIKKVDDESDLDVEIDIEDSDEEKKLSSDLPKTNFRQSGVINDKQITEKSQDNNNDNLNPTEINLDDKEIIDFSTLDETVSMELMSLELPQAELILDRYAVTELERIMHSEFFEGRPTKTPKRYLLIRNHIVNTWISQKPNYVTKTAARSSLKNCGDVNCIGRIHYFLEQIGAINFGCSQMKYVRPLYDMLKLFLTVREKSSKEVVDHTRINAPDSHNRARHKKKLSGDGEGGCTLTHNEKGDVINTVIVNEEPAKPRLYVKKPTVRLIYCRPFSEENPQPYTVKIHLSTLLVMDFHAHTSLTEVMGLVAGFWIPQDNTLTVSYYEPCLNIASSATHCDMCPISQAKAADIIHQKGLNIVGWFHSHPTFAPEPSQQDIDTQQVVQKWIGHNKPCIGMILSPFSLNGALIASPFRCMIVDKKVNFEDQMVPYKFKTELVTDNFDLKGFLQKVRSVCRSDVGGAMKSKVEFDKPYFQDPMISYSEKYITSVRMHLAKCGTLSKMFCDNIIEGITHICTNNKRI